MPNENEGRETTRPWRTATTWLKGSAVRLAPAAPDAAQDAAIIGSPARWDIATKLLVGQLGLVIVVLLAIQLRALFVPLLVAFILVLLFNPVADWIHRRTGWPWPVGVILVYVTLIAIGIVVALKVGGVVYDALGELASSASSAADTLAVAAPNTASAGMVRQVAAAGAGFVGQVAVQTAALLGQLVFVLAVSFFVLVEGRPRKVRVPASAAQFGLARDLHVLAGRITGIWGTWIYSQFVLCGLTFVMYFTTMTVLGVQNALGIALVSMVGRFIPNIGAVITWSAVFVSAYLQGSNPFGLSAAAYAVLCVGVSIVIDQSFDQFVAPRIYGQAFKLPSAAVIVGMMAGGLLMGFFGMFTAAPIMASGVVIARYIGSRVIAMEAGDDAAPAVAGAEDGVRTPEAASLAPPAEGGSAAGSGP